MGPGEAIRVWHTVCCGKYKGKKDDNQPIHPKGFRDPCLQPRGGSPSCQHIGRSRAPAVRPAAREGRPRHRRVPTPAPEPSVDKDRAGEQGAPGRDRPPHQHPRAGAQRTCIQHLEACRARSTHAAHCKGRRATLAVGHPARPGKQRSQTNTGIQQHELRRRT